MNNILLYFSIKYAGEWDKISHAVTSYEKIKREDFENFLLENKDINFITILDDNYPKSLLRLFNPPFVLFFKGDINILAENNKTAIIGSRKNSWSGRNITIKLSQIAAKRKEVIVSGMALGIDSIAHQGSIDNEGKTIAVLGSGIDYIYPLANKKLYYDIINKGLVISEYPNLTSPKPINFKNRNRIIAALSNKVIVTEANLRSGTMNTVKWALDIGIDIYCVPSRNNLNSGCNKLIQEGAKVIYNENYVV